MRNLRIVGLFLLVLLVLSFLAFASENKLGIHEVSKISFDTPVRIGTALLPAGNYVIRHTMEGQDHVMAFERVNSKDVFKVKCTLVPLTQKADRTQTVYEVSGNERIVHELVFRGDTAKHVF